MKSKFKIFATLLLAVVMGTTFVGCNKNNNDNKPSGEEGSGSTTVGTAQSFVSLDINPSIELTVDENDLVVSVYGANEDGQILLTGEDDLVGEDVEQVVEEITDLAVEYGYLTEDNKVVNICVTAKNKQKADEIRDKINDKILERGGHHGFGITPKSEGTFSIIREYEKFLQENPTYEGVLSIEKFKLAYSVALEGDIELKVAVDMDEEELIEMVKNVHDKYEGVVTDDFKTATKEAKRIYNQEIDSKLAKVYDDFYKANLSKYPVTGLYRGKIYYAYKIAEIGFDSLLDGAKIHDCFGELVLSEDDINSVLEVLNLTADDIDLIKNRNGDVTINGIKHYIDIMFKNIADGEDKELIKEELEDLLDVLEDNIKNAVDFGKYEGDFNLIKTQISEQVNAVKAIMPQLAEVPQELTDFIAEMEGVIAEMELALENGLTKEVIEGFADAMEDGAEEILEVIEEEIGDDLSSVEDMFEREREDCHDFEERFDKALEDAHRSAKDYLEGQKEQVREHGAGHHNPGQGGRIGK